MVCDSDTNFQVSKEQLDIAAVIASSRERKTAVRPYTSVDRGQVHDHDGGYLAGIAMCATSAVIADLERLCRCTFDFTQDSHTHTLGEFGQWLGIRSPWQEGPSQRARRISGTLTKGSFEASSVAWACVVNLAADAFSAGEVHSLDWLAKYINKKEMYCFYRFLQQFCTRHSDVLWRAQVLIDVNSR